ncbi:serine/threonine-protein phosphatase 7 long form homolog [Hibiscus syriacus]|uniref:serine/threonine-protein phosphatase 7 long form homolog n=1 Tax=Hibiscus syriacus TaxID=106335 RepID=UPI0019215F39|nr:serine/threonine-protein phosphatase 7 long form homolog [Hibiscus syriacus]
MDIPRPIWRYLDEAGFGYIAKIGGGCKLEPILISALIERWRPETHTFHLPCGECTITLEDVSMHLGLPVDGNVICGVADGDWHSLCEEYLGGIPPEFNGGRIPLAWLQSNFQQLNENCSEDEAKAFARAYILRVIGGILMPDKSRNKVHCMWLRHLTDFRVAGTLSWGSAVLAFLFKEMCRATDYQKTAIGGCLLLLQSWAWYRMPFLCPVVNEPFVFPLLLRWSSTRKNHRAIPDELEEIRLLIDQKIGTEFQWTPYATNEIRVCLPPNLSGQLDVWMTVVPLICYAIVEWHPIDRVLRQFGCVQYIPRAPINLDNMHNIDRRGKKDVNWVMKHKEWIMMWEDRHQRIPPRQYIHETGYSVTDDYISWFNMNGKPFLLSEEARGGRIHQRREKRPPSQHHRPSTRGQRANTSGSSSAAAPRPSQHPPSLPGYIPSPPIYMTTPPVQIPLHHPQMPPQSIQMPQLPIQMAPPHGYVQTPQGFMPPFGGYYITMPINPTWASYAAYSAGGAPPQTFPPQYGSQTSMSMFSQFSQFSMGGGMVSHTLSGSLFYTGPTSSSIPYQQNVAGDTTAAADDDESEEEEQPIRRNHHRNRQSPSRETHSRKRHR